MIQTIAHIEFSEKSDDISSRPLSFFRDFHRRAHLFTETASEAHQDERRPTLDPVDNSSSKQIRFQVSKPGSPVSPQFGKCQTVRIHRLEKQFPALNEEKAAFQASNTPAGGILSVLKQNATSSPQGRRDSLETLVRARHVGGISPNAWKTVRKVLPVPGKRLLLLKFTETKGISETLVDPSRIGELIHLWRQAVPPGGVGCPVVLLSVDPVAFRPLISIHEDGHVERLKNMKELDSPDLFSQFISGPVAFLSFVKEHWDDAETALFAFQLQRLHPDDPCSIIHAMPATNGKGNREVVQKLLDLKDALEHQFDFFVVGMAFDGDSAFRTLHKNFRDNWRPLIMPHIFSIPVENVESPVIICDPLHLMKRIRYRWVSAVFSLGFGADLQSSFSTETIQL
jgi:hypothetical protein